MEVPFSLIYSFFYLILLQDWLDKHADYEAIVDGANIGLYQQNFANGEFSIPQVVQPNSLTCLPLLLYLASSFKTVILSDPLAYF